MFDNITETWNPVVGCLHSCTYCWARRLAETKLKNIERYKDGLKPKLVEKESIDRLILVLVPNTNNCTFNHVD